MPTRSTLTIVALSALGLALAFALLISLGLNWKLAERDGLAAAPEPRSAPAEPLARVDLSPPKSIQTPTDARTAVDDLGDERVPNLERVAGMRGAFVRDQWPNGAPMFEAQQTQQRDGEWVLDGAWTAWHANGEREELGRYAQGREDGTWLWWYENGEQQAEGQFDRGRRIGTWSFWHASGAKLAQGAYENGERSGAWRFWTADGTLHEEHSGVYRRGERVSALVR